MFRHKLTGALLLGAIFAAGAGLCCIEPTAASAAAILQLNNENSSLALPTSYEQYLTLSAPSDIAVSERYIAIAEESTIYLFDREEQVPTYHTYDHAPAHKGAQISKIQFSDDEELYFSDSLLGFYELDLSDLSALKPVSDTSITSLSTFYLEKDTVFEVSVVNGTTTYLSAPISDPKTATPFANDDNTITPQLSYANGHFYSAVGALVTAYSYSETEQIYKATGNYPLQPGLTGLKAISVVGDSLYYSVSRSSSTVSDGLYRCDLTSSGYTPLLAGSGYGALTSYDGKLYAVKGNAVMEYDLGDGTSFEKTDYEISSASDSINRLSAATDSARAGDLLVTADNGNRRISVCNMQTGVYTTIAVDYDPKLVATDGELIAVAADTRVFVYEWNSRTKGYELSYQKTVSHTIMGIACLYGKCYFVTHGFEYGVADREELCTRDGVDQKSPVALANDLYGNLYVVSENGSVNQYTESNFCDSNTRQGKVLSFTLPENFRCVRADFEGDIFCLDGANVLYKNGETVASIDGGSFVYGDGPMEPLSYALGFEDDCVYFNFGNFIVRSDEGVLGFPTLKTIDAAGVYEELSRVHAPEEVRHTDVIQGAVGIQVDISSLDEDTVSFPFASYARTAEKGRGVVLAETAKYELVALYHDRGYDVRLFRLEQCTDAETAVAESAGRKFLSSACTLYNYPCIADAAQGQLARGTRVRVISVVSQDSGELGYDFAYVEAETSARESARGYVPLSFLTEADPAGGASEDFEIVKLKEDTLFGGPNGELTLKAGTEVRLYAEEDGILSARYTDANGKLYYQTLTEEMIDRGANDALRIALIVILSVLALVIIGAYFALLPHEKKPKKR